MSNGVKVDMDAIRQRIDGLERRIGELLGENKILRAKIHGQREVIRELQAKVEGGDK